MALEEKVGEEILVDLPRRYKDMAKAVELLKLNLVLIQNMNEEMKDKCKDGW